MKAVLCLIRIFFTASPLLCGGTLLGLALLLFGTLGYAFMPEWTIARPQSWETQWLESVVLVLPWLGLILLLAAGALMPVIVERIALGRGVWLLPHGRRRLLVATVLPAAVLALLTAVAALAALRVLSIDIVFGRFFWRTWLIAFVDIGLIYTAMWFVSKTSGVWRLAGLTCVVISITIPVRYLGSSFEAISLLEVLGLVCWIAFGIAVLAGGRLRHGFAGRRTWLAALWRRLLPGESYAVGSEAALLLGTTRPWRVAVGQIVPIVVMALVIPVSQAWLAILIAFSAIAGAVTSQASARSRRLWLKRGWSRDELARRVESAYWQYNLCSLGVLLAAFFGLVLYQGIATDILWFGLALLTLGCIVSTYLGLLVTRGLGWLESALCIATMTALTLASLTVMRGEFVAATQWMLGLAGLAVAYRLMARARWRELDWMLARSA